MIETDSVVTVHYTGTLPDGEEFDSSRGGEPMTFLVGHKQMIPGFEEELMGASSGESREFTLPPERAYGERDDDAIQQVSREQFPEDMELKPGMMMAAQTDQGPIPFTISEIDGNEITIDFNHQMAGKTLIFNVEIIEIRDATPDEIAHGHVHGPSGNHQHPEEKKDNCGDGCGCN